MRNNGSGENKAKAQMAKMQNSVIKKSANDWRMAASSKAAKHQCNHQRQA